MMLIGAEGNVKPDWRLGTNAALCVWGVCESSHCDRMTNLPVHSLFD